MNWIPTPRMTLVAGLAATALGLGLALVTAHAADARPTYSVVDGNTTYQKYCANCHGVKGHGDGEIAATLMSRPTNLTQLAAKEKGVYPEERVRETIDGRVQVAAHGTREMPVWGNDFIWPEEDTPARRAQVEQRIGDLVAFIQSLQAPADKH